jgi:hypothetical protein
MNNEIFQDVFGEIFTKEEWDSWVKGEFNLFDNYVERVGMSKEDAYRLRERFRKTEERPKKKSAYQSFIDNPIDLTKL